MALDPLHIAIIGAGPIGLEAALSAIHHGLRVSLFERGRVAEHVKRWGHVRLFSPFGMNSSVLGKESLTRQGAPMPADDALMTGAEFAKSYLAPLASDPGVRSALHEQTEVASIGRAHFFKGDVPGDRSRAGDPFVLLLRDERGERTVEADCVLDCSGTYGNHNWLGAGGIPCPGELAAANEIVYDLRDWGWQFPTLLRSDGKPSAVLVVGGGYSAATTMVNLENLHQNLPKAPIGRVYWATRNRGDVPIPRIPGDRLPERDRLAVAANEIALSADAFVEWLPGCVVRRIERRDDGQSLYVAVENSTDGTSRTVAVDRIIANVGYRPDRSLYEELQVHECYATQGPMKLAAKLLGETSVDCLDQTSYGADVLRNPEPNFFILGAKSYGRNSSFLIQVGLQQIVDVFRLIDEKVKE